MSASPAGGGDITPAAAARLLRGFHYLVMRQEPQSRLGFSFLVFRALGWLPA
jgi:hypothetical protein